MLRLKQAQLICIRNWGAEAKCAFSSSVEAWIVLCGRFGARAETATPREFFNGTWPGNSRSIASRARR
jgi:hypothetical protein